jgi:hypothetical protein
LTINKKQTISYSFRLDKEWLEILRKEAERQGISVNAIHNRILKNYCLHWRWVERLKPVILTRPTIAGIIGCCPEDRVKEIAKISGSTGTKDALRTLGINPTYDKLTNFIKENLGKSANWFDYSHHIRGKKDIIHLRHELGRKWSLFIANQTATMFKSILGITAKTEIFDNSTTIEITI